MGVPIWRCLFWSKVNIWNVNYARVTTFIFDIRTDVSVKVSTFLRLKYLDLRGTRTPNLRIHAERSNHLSYQGVPIWRCRYVGMVVLTIKMKWPHDHFIFLKREYHFMDTWKDGLYWSVSSFWAAGINLQYLLYDYVYRLTWCWFNSW